MTYQEFLKKAKEKDITNIQIAEHLSTGSEGEILDGKLDSFNDYNNRTYEIKAEYNNKTIKTICNYLSEEIIDLLIMKSINTDSNYQDEYLEKDENIECGKLVEIDISNELKILKDLEKIKKEYKSIEKLATYFYEENDITRIINSKGIDISTNSYLCSFLVEAIAKNNDEVTAYDRRILTTDKKDINFINFTRDVCEKVVIQSNKEKLETKKYNIILDNVAASRIIAHLTDMIAASSIRQKMSCLEDKLDKEIFSKKITIVEEPTNKKYPGYRLFDNEGTKTRNKIIIENGKLKTYLYNIKESKIKGVTSTGNGYSNINVRNMYLIPGDKSLEELIKDLNDGIYITDFMGSQSTSINNVNGQISLQVFGFIVEDGKIIKGFVPAIMTTTIFELLSNVEAIGNDLIFNNTKCASPSLLIRDVSIAS